MIERTRHVDIAAILADGGHQFDLVLEIVGIGRIGYCRAIIDDGVARFLEKERRVAFVRLFHLADVRGVVAADAIDAPHRIQTAVHDRQHGRFDGGEDELVGHWWLSG